MLLVGSFKGINLRLAWQNGKVVPILSFNVATEDGVLMLSQMGFDTGIGVGKLAAAADLAAELTGNCDGGNASRWIKRQIEKGELATAS